MSKQLCLVVLFAFATGPSVTLAAPSIGFDINVGPGFYSATPDPNFYPGDPDLPFVTATIASSDGVYQVTSSQNSWNIQSGIFSTLDALKASVLQTWSIELDQGLPTERNYTMMLSLDNLEEADLAPPVINFPSFNETISTLTPDFEFELPIPRMHALQLHDFPLTGSSTILTQTSVAAGTTTWSYHDSLLPDTRYLFGLRTNVGFSEQGFTIPLDSSGVPLVPLAEWESDVSARVETNIAFFTAVPEPGGLLLLSMGGIVLYGLRRQQQFRRP